MADDSSSVTVNIKGPSEIKLTVQVALDDTVRGLKEKIAEQRSDIPAESQRLIYTGKVLKDEETLASYKLQNNHTIHMVRSAARSTPVSGNTSNTATAAASGTPASGGSAAQGVPSSFGAGQAYGSDPMAALNRADFAGPHMAALNRNMFEGMGMNPNDPNMLMTAMQSDEFRTQMRDMLSRPEVVDQIIASNPQLSQMPGVRELFQSEQFREMLVDPQSMARAAELSRSMGGMGGMAGLGGMGNFGGAGQGGGGTGAAQWPPAGAFGQQGTTPSTGSTAAGQQPSTGAGAANPFAALMGGAGAGAGAGGAGESGGMFDPALMRQMFGGGGGAQNPFAGFGRPAAPTDSRPPEERYSDQLAQMQGMGLTDGSANLRALLMAGGSVEGAMSILFDDPTAGAGGARP
ncbi:hypothetical protein CBS101457_004034 [Exobasidium rhododendri]|nr:hypothetical protein CBS101457_004034 [Exobasidium rhododendri]